MNRTNAAIISIQTKDEVQDNEKGGISLKKKKKIILLN